MGDKEIVVGGQGEIWVGNSRWGKRRKWVGDAGETGRKWVVDGENRKSVWETVAGENRECMGDREKMGGRRWLWKRRKFVEGRETVGKGEVGGRKKKTGRKKRKLKKLSSVTRH